MKATIQRMPKADYFRMRYANAIAEGLTDKAIYFRGRLEEMNEPLEVAEEVAENVSRDHEVSNIDRLVAVRELLLAVGVDTSIDEYGSRDHGCN